MNFPEENPTAKKILCSPSVSCSRVKFFLIAELPFGLLLSKLCFGTTFTNQLIKGFIISSPI